MTVAPKVISWATLPWGARSGVSDTVYSVMQMIDAHYMEESLSIASLAQGVYLTPTYLSGVFKKETGQTIGEYIVKVRMEEARKMLADKSMKLYEVAGRCGYVDQNYFAKVFKRQTGVTPSEYRKKWM